MALAVVFPSGVALAQAGDLDAKIEALARQIAENPELADALIPELRRLKELRAARVSGEPAPEETPAEAETALGTDPPPEQPRSRRSAVRDEPGEPIPLKLEIGLGLGLWNWFAAAEARTATEENEVRGLTAFDLQLSLGLGIGERFGLRLAPELSVGIGTQTWLVGLGAYYDFPLFGGQPLGFLKECLLRPRAGFCIAGFTARGAPGSYDPAIGFDVGAEFVTAVDGLPTGWWFVGALDLRYLRFRFDEDAEVVDSDSGYGGLSVILRLGVLFRF